MPDFIVDASAALPWCLEDEATPWSIAVLKRILDGSLILVPSLWSAEVANALLVAERKQRITTNKIERFFRQVEKYPIESEPIPLPACLQMVMGYARQYRLSVYDAIYLELALRRGLPIATLDGDLKKACLAEGVPLL